jgi:hypothetical protein
MVWPASLPPCLPASSLTLPFRLYSCLHHWLISCCVMRCTESLSLVVLIILTMFLIDAPKPLTPAYAGGLTALCFSVGMLFFARIILARYEKYRVEIAHIKTLARKRAEAQLTIKQQMAHQRHEEHRKEQAEHKGAEGHTSAGAEGGAALTPMAAAAPALSPTSAVASTARLQIEGASDGAATPQPLASPGDLKNDDGT